MLYRVSFSASVQRYGDIMNDEWRKELTRGKSEPFHSVVVLVPMCQLRWYIAKVTKK